MLCGLNAVTREVKVLCGLNALDLRTEGAVCLECCD